MAHSEPLSKKKKMELASPKQKLIKDFFRPAEPSGSRSRQENNLLLLSETISSIKYLSCRGLRDSLLECLTVTSSWLESHLSLSEDVSKSLENLGENRASNWSLTQYFTMLYSSLVDRNGSEIPSPLVPVIAEEMVSLLSSGLSAPDFIPHKRNLRILIQLLNRTDLRDFHLFSQSVWIFMDRLLRKYPPHDSESRAYWIYALTNETYLDETEMITAFRSCVSQAFGNKEGPVVRWFLVSLLERDMCASLLGKQSSELPSLSNAPLAFFLFFDAEKRSRGERIFSDSAIRTMSEWLQHAVDWTNSTSSTKLIICVRLVSVIFEGLRFINASAEEEELLDIYSVPEAMQASLRQLVRMAFRTGPSFVTVSYLFQARWMQLTIAGMRSNSSTK